VLGTAAYLAPEQARGEEAGPRADLYSLGVVAYQLMSGRLPYEASSLTELALKQQREAPMPLERLNPSVPRTLSDAVAMALALDKAQRPPDAGNFAEALRSGARGVDPYTAITQYRPRSPTAEAPTAHIPTSATRQVPPRRRPPSPRQAETAATRLSDRPPGLPRERPEGPRTWQPPPRQKSGLGRSIRRTILVMLLLMALVAAIIAAVELASGGTTSAQFRHVVAHDAQQAINQLRSIIGDYSK
jgi:serine/threonine-protein kinase